MEHPFIRNDANFSASALVKSIAWHAPPMIVCSAITFFGIFTFELYLVYRLATPSTNSYSLSSTSHCRRHLFLGQTLMLGLLLGSAVSMIVPLDTSSNVSCTIIYLGSQISYALIYDSLLVKLILLTSMNSGVYLPASYQTLLFGFILLVQIAICNQIFMRSHGAFCSYPEGYGYPLSMCYIIFLLAVIGALSFKSWNIRDNNRETRCIGVLVLISCIIWMAWLSAYILLATSLRRITLGAGLLSVVIVTFIVMYVPKSRQHNMLGMRDDRHEQYDVFCNCHHNYPTTYASSSADIFGQQPSSATFYPGRNVRPTRRQLVAANYWREQRITRKTMAEGSYAGFHRPLRVVPPSSTAGDLLNHTWGSNLSDPSYFPSHFYPYNMNHYWRFYAKYRV